MTTESVQFKSLSQSGKDFAPERLMALMLERSSLLKTDDVSSSALSKTEISFKNHLGTQKQNIEKSENFSKEKEPSSHRPKLLSQESKSDIPLKNDAIKKEPTTKEEKISFKDSKNTPSIANDLVEGGNSSQTDAKISLNTEHEPVFFLQHTTVPENILIEKPPLETEAIKDGGEAFAFAPFSPIIVDAEASSQNVLQPLNNKESDFIKLHTEPQEHRGSSPNNPMKQEAPPLTTVQPEEKLILSLKEFHTFSPEESLENHTTPSQESLRNDPVFIAARTPSSQKPIVIVPEILQTLEPLTIHTKSEKLEVTPSPTIPMNVQESELPPQNSQDFQNHSDHGFSKSPHQRMPVNFEAQENTLTSNTDLDFELGKEESSLTLKEINNAPLKKMVSFKEISSLPNNILRTAHFDLAKQFQDAVALQKSNFEIKLNPEGLGTIHIRIHFDKKTVEAHFSLEQNAMPLFQKNTDAITGIFEANGFHAQENGLTFSMHQGQSQNHQNPQPWNESSQKSLETDLLAFPSGRHSSLEHNNHPPQDNPLGTYAFYS